MQELKPCPFCKDGGKPKHTKVVYHSCESNLIKCMKCEVSTCGYATEEEAIAVWNTRAERTCKMTWHYSDNGGSAYTCSNCGRDTYPFNKSFEHCPHCTAKVVS